MKYFIVLFILLSVAKCTYNNSYGEKKPVKELTSEQDLKSDYVVVDFYATWCGPCDAQSTIMEKLSVKYNVLKCDVDKTDIDNKYNVKSLPTIIVFKNGVEVERYIGLTNYSTLKNYIDGL